LQEEISKAKSSGAVVFATLQYNEQPLGDYSYETARSQANDFARLVDAGADVVSGSQGDQHGHADSRRTHVDHFPGVE
jgi:poly-gamma-glutamate capsule biosynthesis protein CapA/YwtB (metallophosphatase superfamily)